VLVMYAGEIVEEAPTASLFTHPLHPYSWGLLNSIPRLDLAEAQPLQEIPGIVPSLTTPLTGCKFAARCPHVFGRCRREHPGLLMETASHQARCWLLVHPERRKARRRSHE
jgi:oligopeptide/dipeptide ABC transporter ATP-binding protein